VSPVFSFATLGFLPRLPGALTLLARILTAALLLARRLILSAMLVLVRHVVSFHENITTTALGALAVSVKHNRQFALRPRRSIQHEGTSIALLR
jgi:hypothetical protein